MANTSTARFGHLARISGRAAVASFVVMLCSAVFAAAPARAACDVLDPTCVVETVEDTADSTTGTVEETVEETTETVDETTETVDETVDSVVSDTEETVDETVGPGIGQVDDAIGGSSQPTLPGSDPVPPRTVDPAPPGDAGTGDGSVVDGSGVGDGPVGTPSGGVVGPFVLDPPALGGAPAVESTLEPRGFLGGLAGPAGALASRIAFPLALALLVFLFVAFQDRLDGRDPKLALAATSPDVLRFG